ncbi:DUF305 domain-containing protein [Rhizohabitans arisaemae]|uniref:DUF305 domain-containing protein n=1 Tax=Rhizohabitans arisaemae TaxID=2720610 RepID=UPI0024B0EEE0|nr:DUF305 domain-containing protein [Rhizohabitans arisaemae]
MRPRLLPFVVLAVLALGGCAAGSVAEAQPAHLRPATGPAAKDAVNPADVMFLQMMVAQNRQSMDIAKLAADRSPAAEVRSLAAAIRATQETEVRTMSGWLRAWDQPLTGKADAHASHGGMPGPSKQQIKRLKSGSLDRFDREFLNLMISLLDDSIQMARVESDSGANTGAKAMARQMDVSRSAQIKHMLKLVDAL